MSETTAEKIARDDAKVRDAGVHLFNVGQLILAARVLDLAPLLDWPELVAYLRECGELGAEGAGFDVEAIRQRGGR